MATRKLYTQEERNSWLQRWRDSGQSGEQFSKVHGFNSSTLYRWRDQVRAAKSVKAVPAFAQVRVQSAKITDDVGVVEVVLPNECRVRVIGAVKREQLQAVLEVLGAC